MPTYINLRVLKIELYILEAHHHLVPGEDLPLYPYEGELRPDFSVSVGFNVQVFGDTTLSATLSLVTLGGIAILAATAALVWWCFHSSTANQ